MPARSVRRSIFAILGTVCLALGIAGIVIPVVPTTPFLLLASACYVRGSERLHRKLMSHRYLGPYIRTFQQGGGIPRRAKLAAITLIWVTMLLAIAKLDLLVLEAALVVVGIAVTTWIATRPSATTQE